METKEHSMVPAWITVFALLIIDQAAKLYVEGNYALGTSIPIVEDIFHFTYIQNPGAAFSILEHQQWFFIGVNIVLFGAAVRYYRRLTRESGWIRYGCALLFGGAVGNLIDRLRLGAVIDFFDFRIWPVFNIADIGICVGVGMMMYAIAFLSTDEEE
ncbi:MAG: signal peptidase II [Selenomonadaceae bacterium]|nr:signal peptidase II [Selenomonadaceae bacterium]